MAALLGVSRTPIREALLRLHAEGLIGPHPEGGYRPIAPAVEQVHDLYEVRMALELQALRRPAELGPPTTSLTSGCSGTSGSCCRTSSPNPIPGS